jgi:hypothetical protein
MTPRRSVTSAVSLPFFALLLGGCAHAQTVTLTSASAVTPTPQAPAPAAPATPPSGDETADEAGDSAEQVESTPTQAEGTKPAEKKSDGSFSFADLSSALGDSGKALAVSVNGPAEAPASKGLSSDGYTAVTAAHQAVDSESSARSVGSIKLGGGMTLATVRTGVHAAEARLRLCYEHGLVADPRLAGRVTVRFSVDAQGSVADVDTESDTIPGDVRACVRDAFSTMTFAPPKTAPAKIVYPLDFNKGS